MTVCTAACLAVRQGGIEPDLPSAYQADALTDELLAQTECNRADLAVPVGLTHLDSDPD